MNVFRFFKAILGLNCSDPPENREAHNQTASTTADELRKAAFWSKKNLTEYSLVTTILVILTNTDVPQLEVTVLSNEILPLWPCNCMKFNNHTLIQRIYYKLIDVGVLYPAYQPRQFGGKVCLDSYFQ